MTIAGQGAAPEAEQYRTHSVEAFSIPLPVRRAGGHHVIREMSRT